MKEQIKKYIIDTISTWTEDDIYVISLFVYDDCDNPCKPTVTLGYNTENQVQSELNKGFATDEEEARWNYAFWIQNEFLTFGINETADIVKKWVIDNGFSYYDDDVVALDMGETNKITRSFVALLIDVVREIHEQKILTSHLGKELPIIIHELEYYDEIAEQNIKANGEELVREFAEWCLYG